MQVAAHENGIASLQGQTADLYEKHEETRRMLSDIKVCVERTNADMKGGFARMEEMIYSLKSSFDKRTLYADGLVLEFKNAVEAMDKRISHVEKSQWLLDAGEWLRNNAWVWVVIGIVGIVVFLMLSHWVETGIALRAKVGIK